MRKLLLLAFFVAILGSCKENWDPEHKRAFFTACTETAREHWAPSDSIANAYCNCIFDKMSKKYPEEEQMEVHIVELAKDTDLMKCKGEVWQGAK